MKNKVAKTNFLKVVKDTIRHYGMLKKGDRVLVAVSGGADSVCLLKALLDVREVLGIEVVAANMDHGLRGAESASESRFVMDLAERLGIPCVHAKLKSGRGRKNKISIEEELRKKRYEFLRRSAKKEKCGVIATGHTMDDQAETVLMRVIKGSSSEGLGGIPPVRQEGGLTVIRPIIRLTRREILSFLRSSGIGHVEDSSNSDMKFLRNRLRHEVFPVLERINPRIKRSLSNMADSVREDMLLLDSIKKSAGNDIGEAGLGDGSISLSELLIQPKSLRKDIFKKMFRDAGGDIKKLTFRHWMEMEGLLRSAEKGKSLDLPGKVRVTRRREDLVFSKRSG